MTDMKPLVVPMFDSESEAAWRESHQDPVTERFAQAAAAGTPGHGRAVRQAMEHRSLDSSRSLTVELPPGDLTRLRANGARKGMGDPNYLQQLVHEGLDREERIPGRGCSGLRD